ncbi:MAG: aromatic ring-hydroxylating dioxygenase subunit alpha [Ramlibacter sp.]|nr:aromatic ring-hydroxylating dioxygenase subunit alpha [Ramlibacter sp.]
MFKLRAIDRDQQSIEKVVKVPIRVYTEPDVLEKELATAFRDYPLVAGHSSQVKEPGSYMLSAWDRIPYVVVRDREGVLRGFLNVCRHRGARLVSGKETELKAFTCPFHGWVYGLDGALKGVTKPYNFPEIDCDKHGLVELTVAEHLGLIWVHPTPGAKIDLPAFLGEQIGSEIEAFKMSEMVVHRRSVSTLNANWKLVLKTYLERYHVPVLHKNTIAPVFEKGVISHHEEGLQIRIAAAKTNLEEALKADPATWKILDFASVFYTLFPNTFLINHANLLSLNSFYPVAPDKTIWTHDMLYRAADYAGEEGQDALTKRFANIDAVFHHEDFGIVEGVQAGLRSGANEYHTMGLEEGLLAIFQNNIDRVAGTA